MEVVVRKRMKSGGDNTLNFFKNARQIYSRWAPRRGLVENRAASAAIARPASQASPCGRERACWIHEPAHAIQGTKSARPAAARGRLGFSKPLVGICPGHCRPFVVRARPPSRRFSHWVLSDSTAAVKADAGDAAFSFAVSKGSVRVQFKAGGRASGRAGERVGREAVRGRAAQTFPAATGCVARVAT